jgi:glycosyltransferase involved in cell wall biosynthesis
MSLAKVLANELLNRNHDVVILLSAAFPLEAKEVRNEFEKIDSKIKFFEFTIPKNCAANSPENGWRQMAARLLREYAIASLKPDVVHVATLLADGWEDDLVASVGLLDVHIPTVLTHYDLIPLVMPDIYLENDFFRDYYMQKIDDVRKADLLLTISEHTKEEARKYLKIPESSLVNISSSVNEDFSTSLKNSLGIQNTLSKYNIETEFLLYAPGGFDPRKNLNRLLEAYSMLPNDIRTQYNLVIASKLPAGYGEGLIWKAGTLGIDKSQLILTDYVPDSDLADLYRGCRAYIFPSLQEGFGLPVLEAMSCGAVVIASNSSSIPEAHGLNEALFDPYEPNDIKNKILLALTDEAFRQKLKSHSEFQTQKFSWLKSATTAANSIEKLVESMTNLPANHVSKIALPSAEQLLFKVNSLVNIAKPSKADLEDFEYCIKRNSGAVS